MHEIFAIHNRHFEIPLIAIHRKHGEGSSTTRSTTAKATGAIVIPDNGESDHDVTSAKDLWTKCGGISLSQKELQRLINGKDY